MSEGGRPFGLTERQDHVIRLVDQDLPDRKIGAVLGISPETVRTHLKHIDAKVGGGSRSANAKRYLAEAGTDEVTNVWLTRVLGTVRAAAIVLHEASQETGAAHEPTPRLEERVAASCGRGDHRSAGIAAADRGPSPGGGESLAGSARSTGGGSGADLDRARGARLRLGFDPLFGGAFDDLTLTAKLQVAGSLALRLLAWAVIAIVVASYAIHTLEPIILAAPNPLMKGARP